MTTGIVIAISIVLFAACLFFVMQWQKNSKKMKQYLTELKSFENIVAHTNDALFVIDISHGKLLHVNNASAVLLGYSEDELLKKSYFDLLPKELMNRSAEIIADVWENKGMVFSDIPHIHKNGEVIHVECSAKVGSFEEQPAIVVYARDIRERLKYENEIKQINEELKDKNKDITDSIRYAQRIQQAILPHEEDANDLFPEHFVLFMPKDIVSGDFYLVEAITTNSGVKLAGFAVVDCTGHGVPGAFMSLLGNSFFKQAMSDPNVNSPAETLDFVNKKLITALKYKEQASVRDGMDASFCVVNKNTNEIYFAGANNPACIIRNNTVEDIEADKVSIGQESGNGFHFKNQNAKLDKGDMVFLYSDGYADQFGGPKGKKFKYKQMEEIMLANHKLEMKIQKSALEKSFTDWKGGLEQVDDVCLIGIRL